MCCADGSFLVLLFIYRVDNSLLVSTESNFKLLCAEMLRGIEDPNENYTIGVSNSDMTFVTFSFDSLTGLPKTFYGG